MVSLPIMDVSLLVFLNNVFYDWILDSPLSVFPMKSSVVVCAYCYYVIIIWCVAFGLWELDLMLISCDT